MPFMMCSSRAAVLLFAALPVLVSARAHAQPETPAPPETEPAPPQQPAPPEGAGGEEAGGEESGESGDEATSDAPPREPSAEAASDEDTTPDASEETPPEAPPQGPSPETRARAREVYERAQSLHGEGQFAEAEAAFSEAFALIPNPVVLLGVAVARERQGDLDGAVEALERYLAERPDAPDAVEIRARIETMRGTPSRLLVRSTPVGATIVLDGSDTGQQTPAELNVSGGEHSLSLTLDGYEAEEQTLIAPLGGEHTVEVMLIELAAEEPEPEDELLGDGRPIDEAQADEGDEETAEAGPGVAVWATAGVAAAGLVAGTVLGFLALSQESEFDETPSEGTADQGERFALFADVAFGVAAVGAITAIVLFLTKDAGEDEETESAHLEVAPSLGRRGGGVSAQVQF